MRWHKSTVEPKPEYNSHFIIKLKDNKYEFVKWSAKFHKFYNENFVNLSFSLDEVNEWCYVEEDDCNTDEMLALTAIQDAVNHVQSLYDTLLTDGICCGEEYRDLIGLNELQIIKDKLTKRILYLDDQI